MSVGIAGGFSGFTIFVVIVGLLVLGSFRRKHLRSVTLMIGIGILRLWLSHNKAGGKRQKQ
jgi:hypothetical protein